MTSDHVGLYAQVVVDQQPAGLGLADLILGRVEVAHKVDLLQPGRPHQHSKPELLVCTAANGRKHGDAFDAVVLGNKGSVQPVADLIEDIVSTKDGVSAAFKRALSLGSMSNRSKSIQREGA